MKDQDKISPLPWRIFDTAGMIAIFDNNNEIVPLDGSEDKSAYPAFRRIVKSANAYPKLIEALKNQLHFLHKLSGHSLSEGALNIVGEMISELQALLKQLGEL